MQIVQRRRRGLIIGLMSLVTMACEPPNAGLSISIYEGDCLVDSACNVTAVNTRLQKTNLYGLHISIAQGMNTLYESDLSLDRLQITGGPQLGVTLLPERYGPVTVRAAVRNRLGCDELRGEATQTVVGGRNVIGIKLLPVPKEVISDKLLTVAPYADLVDGKPVQKFQITGENGLVAEADLCTITKQARVGGQAISKQVVLNAQNRWVYSEDRLFYRLTTASDPWVVEDSGLSRGGYPVSWSGTATDVVFSASEVGVPSPRVYFRNSTDSGVSPMWTTEVPVSAGRPVLPTFSRLSGVVATEGEFAVGLEDPGTMTTTLAVRLGPNNWRAVTNFGYPSGGMTTTWSGPGPRYLLSGSYGQKMLELRGSLKGTPIVLPHTLPPNQFLAGWKASSITGWTPTNLDPTVDPSSIPTSIWVLEVHDNSPSPADYRLMYKASGSASFVDLSGLFGDLSSHAPTSVTAVSEQRVFIIGANGWRAVLDNDRVFEQ